MAAKFVVKWGAGFSGRLTWLRDLALATGIFNSGSNFGAMAAPLIGVLDATGGNYNVVFLVCAGVYCAGVYVVATLIIHLILPRHRDAITAAPELAIGGAAASPRRSADHAFAEDDVAI